MGQNGRPEFPPAAARLLNTRSEGPALDIYEGERTEIWMSRQLRSPAW